MIATGPNIEDIHALIGCLRLSSVDTIWNFLIELIKNLSQN